MKHHAGRIELVCGCMFSGKTEEMIRRLRRAEIAKQKVQVFKPAMDTRHDKQTVASHSGNGIAAVSVRSAAAIVTKLYDSTTVVGIDEVQFFDEAIVELAFELARRGIRVIMAGLDCDFRGEAFGPMARLVFKADYVDKLHAICMVCGEEASWTQRLVDGQPAFWDEPIILVGAEESYEARCREHHEVPRRDDFSEVKAILDSLSKNDGNRRS